MNLSMFTQIFKLSTCSPLLFPLYFTWRMLMNFWMKNWLFFCKLNIKDGNDFYTDIYYIYDNNTKNTYMIIYKKEFKNKSMPFGQNFQQLPSNLLEGTLLAVWKIRQFLLQHEHRDRLNPSTTPVCFHLLFKDSLPPL